MHYDLIIKNGTIVTGQESFTGSLAVKDGKIAAAGKLENTDTADEIYDAQGKHVLPGILDTHVHFRDPGLTEKEDFETGSIAAAFGGITFVADMPNVIPVTSTAERFSEKVCMAKEKSYIDFGLYALLPGNTDEMEKLKNAGALGFKVFLGTSTGDIAAPNGGLLFELMQKSASLGSTVCFHAETSDINSYFTSLAMKKTDVSNGLLLADARPVLSEVLAIQTAICYAQHTGAKIHILHVTSADGAALIAEAKQKGINVTGETCPHYLLLDSGMEKTNKVFPPIRGKTHQDGLWDALEKGILDMIATDHAPHTAGEKELPLWEMPGGLTGVETFVPLMLNEVNKGRLSINDFVKLASETPAKIWGIYPRKGSLLPGTDADITIVDMNQKSIISTGSLHSKSKTSAYDGMEVQGLPFATIVRGKFVMKDRRLTGKKGYGTLVFQRAR